MFNMINYYGIVKRITSTSSSYISFRLQFHKSYISPANNG